MGRIGGAQVGTSFADFDPPFFSTVAFFENKEKKKMYYIYAYTYNDCITNENRLGCIFEEGYV